MTDRNETRAVTHADDCWSWGPAHYECAVETIERLRQDAERYRWLRDANINTLPYDDHGIGPEFPCGDDLDAAVDSAMRKGGKQ